MKQYLLNGRALDEAVKAFEGSVPSHLIHTISDHHLRRGLFAVLEAVRDEKLGMDQLVTVTEVQEWVRGMADTLYPTATPTSNRESDHG